MPVGSKKDIPFGTWLREEMIKRGYELEGPRPGGRSRLAKEAGVDLSIVSRILNENRVPEIKALRAIGTTLGYSLGEMMMHAGIAGPDEGIGVSQTGLAHEVEAAQSIRPVDLPPGVHLPDLPDWERHIWFTPGLTVKQRGMQIMFGRVQRGDLSVASSPEFRRFARDLMDIVLREQEGEADRDAG